MIRITDALSVPDGELTFTASRSGGPGGQNVNKVSTRVMLRFDVARSGSLTDEQRARIGSRLRGRITKDGVLVITSQEHRTQPANRAAALERFVGLLREALRPVVTRKRTRTPRAAKERRMESKRLRSRIKQLRSRNISPEE